MYFLARNVKIKKTLVIFYIYGKHPIFSDSRRLFFSSTLYTFYRQIICMYPNTISFLKDFSCNND